MKNVIKNIMIVLGIILVVGVLLYTGQTLIVEKDKLPKAFGIILIIMSSTILATTAILKLSGKLNK